MRSIFLFAGTLSVALVAVAGPPAVPPTPAAVDDIVYVRPFTLETGFRFDWSKERPLVTSGTLLVLRVDEDLVIPRQAAEPVLYVGDGTAQRVNHGNESGYVIAIVPGDVDLSQAPIWFGTPELPERVDAAMAKAERALADKAGIKAFSPTKINTAATKGGERLNVADLHALLRGPVAELVLEYSPQEKRLADAFRVPVAKQAPKPAED